VISRKGAATPLGRWCESNRVSYATLAERAGMARSTLILVATGERVPSTTHALALKRETGLSFEALVLGSPRAVEAATRGTIQRRGVMR
jgi:transcriptional regulator with XRE-family HTH domain